MDEKAIAKAITHGQPKLIAKGSFNLACSSHTKQAVLANGLFVEIDKVQNINSLLGKQTSAKTAP